MAKTTRATGETQSPRVKPGRGATARFFAAVAVLFGLGALVVPAPADATEIWSPDRRFKCTVPDRISEHTTAVTLQKFLAVDCSVQQRTTDRNAYIYIWSAGSGTATQGGTYLGGRGWGQGDYEFFGKQKVHLIDSAPVGATRSMLFYIADDDLVEGPEYFQFALKWVLKIGWWPFVFTYDEAVHLVTVWIDDDEGFRLSVSPDSVWEDQGTTKMTVTATALEQPPGHTVTLPIKFGAAGDSATEGTDYAQVADFPLVFPAGHRTASATVDLTPTQDDAVEGDETISIGSTLSTGAPVTGTSLTLTDADSETIRLSVSPGSVAESASATSITVTATANVTNTAARAVTVSVGSGGDSASEGTDYTAVSDFTITIPANGTTATGTFTLMPTQDTLAEGNERISVYGSATGIPVRSAFVTLTDDERANVTMNVNVSSVNEGDTAKTVTVELHRTVNVENYPINTTIAVGQTGDSATEGTDYETVADFDVNIQAYHPSASGTFRLTPKQDTLVEGGEKITILGTSFGNTVESRAIYIIDDDGVVPADPADPAVTLSASPSKVAEGAGATTVTVTATVDDGETVTAATALTIEVGKAGDAAVSGADYQAVSDFTITIPKDGTSASGTFTLTPIDDSLPEHSVTQSLSIEGSATGVDVTGTSVEIEDNDRPVTLSVSPAKVGEGAGETTVTVTAQHATGVNAPAATAVTVSVGASADSATSGTDYKAVSDFTVTIANGKNKGTATFKLTPTDDASIEGDEKIGVSGTLTGQKVTGTTLTLEDNDRYDVALSASPTSVDEDDSATQVTVTATMASAATASTDVTVSVGAGTDSATSGSDYSAVSDFTVTIAKDAKTGTASFTLTPTDDDDYEGDEKISVTGSSTGRKVSATSVTLAEDDKPKVELKVNPAKIAEDGGKKKVTVTAELQDSVTLATREQISIIVGRPADSAKNGLDFNAGAIYQLDIWPGQSTGVKTFDLTPVDDTLSEGPEEITIWGSHSGLKMLNEPRITIKDDDGPIIDLSISPATIAENGGAVTATVTATMREANSTGDDAGASSRGGAEVAAAKDTTVSISMGASGDGALSGTDYQKISNFNITIKSGQSKGSGTVTVTPVDDKVLEGDETVSATGSATGITVFGTTAKLIDNDSVALTLSTSPATVAENASDTTVTVTASTGGVTSTQDTTFTLRVGGGTATSGTDYEAVKDFDLTISANQTSGTATFTLKPTDDTLIEGDETIEVGIPGSTVSAALVTLSDNDDATITLTAAPSSVAEDASGTPITVTAATGGGTFGAAQTVSVTVGAGTDSATSGTDYAAVAGFDITIAQGSSSGTGTFTLTPTDDTLIEGDETISVDGSATGLTVNGTDMTLTEDDEATIALTVSLSNSSIAESAAATEVTVTAMVSGGTFAADQDVAVTVGAGTDSATSGTDYAAVTGFDVTVTAGQTSGTGTFTLTPTNDTIVEGNETITVAGTATDLTITSGTITVTDDDATEITLTTNPAELGESATGTVVTVTASTDGDTFPADTTVTVTVGDSADGATSGTDYAAVSSFDVTITAGDTSGTGTFTLTPTADTLVEGDETITVAGTATGLTVNGATPKLTDDDTPNFSLAVAPSSVDENAAATSVTVTASTGGVTFAAERKVTVAVGDSADSASTGTDYAAVTGFDITIAAGQTSATGTFTLTPTDDTVIEGDETITVAGTTTGYTVAGATVTLADDDATEITLAVSPSTVDETDSATSVTVTASTDGDTFVAATTVTITVGAAGDGATSGTDYAAVTDFDVTIAAGQTSGTGTFTLTPTNDSIIEGDEAITVSGASTGLTVNGTTATIEDDDKPNIVLTIKPYLNADPTGLPESAPATTVTVTAGTTGGTFALDRQIHVTVGKDGDAAVSGTDYAAVTAFHVMIKAGDTSADNTFTLTPTDDKIVEGSEALTVSGSAAGLSVSSATITLSDNDAPSMSLSTSPSSVAETASGTSVTVTAATGDVTFPEDKTVTVTVGASGDGATSGTDYAAVSSFDVTITKGDSSGTGTFTLTPTDDDVVEGSETLSVTGSMTSYTVTAATMTLTDDDSATVTIADAKAEEGDDITFTVTLSEAVQGGLTVTPSFTDGTAVEGTDYTANTTAMTFTGTKGETQTFTVATTEDAVLEADETFTVGLSASDTPTGTTVTADDTAIGTIEDDDDATVTVDDASADEGGSMTFTVTLDKAAQDGLTVTPSFTDVTAVEGTDYTANTTALTFTGTKGETQTFTVATTEDTVVEGDETFTVGLTVSGTTLSITATDTGTGTINNDDSVAVTVEDESASEGDDITFTVTLDQAVQDGLTVTPSFTDGTAKEGTDYDANTTALTFTGTANETQTFTVSTTEDAAVEADETFTVGLSVSDAPPDTTVTATDTGTGTIEDDDEATVTVDDASADEDESMTFTVTLSAAVQGGLTVTPSFTDGTAVAGTDYDANTTALTFTGTNGETQTFTVSTTQDTVVEGDETFTVDLSVSDTTLSITATDTGTGTVTDDDTTEIALSVAPASVAEEAGATTVTVTATTDGDTFAADQTVTVSVGDSTDTAISGTDYAAVTAFALTITAGQTKGTATFTLTPTDDILIETDETLTVAGSATGLTVTAAPVTLTDDDKEVIARQVQPAISLAAAPASVSEGAQPTPITVTATVGDGTVAFPDARTVTLTVGAAADAATKGTDYAAVTDVTFTIPAGQTTGTGTFTLTPTDDTVVELDEALTVAGASPDLEVAGTGVTLADDDTATLTVSDSAGLEGEALTFTLSLSQPVPEAVTVSYATGDGTATVADADYTATTGSLTFRAGTTTGTLTVPTTTDPVVEPDETLTVTVSAAGSRVEVSEPGATGTIRNDDVAQVTVGNVEGVEGESLTFTVTLSAPVYTAVVLAYATRDGTATVADADYVPAAQTLTIRARATTTTTAVETLSDGLVEDDETFAVQVRRTADTVAGVVLGAVVPAGTVQAAGHAPDHVEGEGTILDDDVAVMERLKRIQTPILADLSLAMTDSVVRAVTARLAQATEQRCARGVTVPGGAPADPELPRSHGPRLDTTPSLRDVLAGSSFVFSLFGDDSDGGADPAAVDAAPRGCGADQRPLTLWGQGDLRSLSGQHRPGAGEAVGWDGSVVGGLVGADVPVGTHGLGGLGVSHFRSAFDYQYTSPRGEEVPGTYETTMTSVHPYAKWTPGPEQSVWLTGGYGQGEVTLEEEKLGAQTADSWWATLAAGGLFRLSPDAAFLPGGTTTVDLKTEAWLTRFQVEDNGAFLKDLSVDTHRLRLAVVGEHTWQLPSGGVVTPLLEVGVRRDGGDGVTGLGVELGGRLGYVDPSGRFTVEGRGHVLTAHEGGKDEWGAGGVIQLAPRADGQGLWFSVVPAYGDVGNGAARLWEQGVTQPAGAAAARPGARVEAQLGYGVLALDRGLVTPYGGLALSGAGDRNYVVGTRLAMRSGLQCSLEGTRSTGGAGTPENYGILVSLDMSW